MPKPVSSTPPTNRRTSLKFQKVARNLEAASTPKNLPAGFDQLPDAEKSLYFKQSAEQANKIVGIIQAGVKKANTENFIDSFRVAIIFEVVILSIVFALSFLLPRHIRPEAAEEGTNL